MSNIFDDFKANGKLLSQWDVLIETGLFDSINSLERDLLDYKQLFSHVMEMLHTKTPEELIDYITNNMLNKFVPGYLAFIYQSEEDKNKPIVKVFHNLKPMQQAPFTISSLAPYRFLFSLSPTTSRFDAFEYLVNDLSLTNIFKVLDPCLVVPLMSSSDMYGFMVIGNKYDSSDYTEKEIAYIRRVMQIAALCLQNHIHYTRAIIDLKTRLYNHFFFIHRLTEELYKIRRYDYEFGLLMIDIDHFKNINDVYGHLSGDRILVEIADILRACTRSVDVACRYGGEEFAILLTQCTKASALTVAERIRKAVSSKKFTLKNDTVTINVSIGVSLSSKSGDLTAERFIEKADLALYNAKNNGRNQVILFKPSMMK